MIYYKPFCNVVSDMIGDYKPFNVVPVSQDMIGDYQTPHIKMTFTTGGQRWRIRAKELF